MNHPIHSHKCYVYVSKLQIKSHTATQMEKLPSCNYPKRKFTQVQTFGRWISGKINEPFCVQTDLLHLFSTDSDVCGTSRQMLGASICLGELEQDAN